MKEEKQEAGRSTKSCHTWSVFRMCTDQLEETAKVDSRDAIRLPCMISSSVVSNACVLTNHVLTVN